MNQLKVWVQAASQAENAALADLAWTTIQMLSQIAGGYRRGGEANVRSDLAIRLEQTVIKSGVVGDEKPALKAAQGFCCHLSKRRRIGHHRNKVGVPLFSQQREVARPGE